MRGDLHTHIMHACTHPHTHAYTQMCIKYVHNVCKKYILYIPFRPDLKLVFLQELDEWNGRTGQSRKHPEAFKASTLAEVTKECER